MQKVMQQHFFIIRKFLSLTEILSVFAATKKTWYESEVPETKKMDVSLFWADTVHESVCVKRTIDSVSRWIIANLFSKKREFTQYVLAMLIDFWDRDLVECMLPFVSPNPQSAQVDKSCFETKKRIFRQQLSVVIPKEEGTKIVVTSADFTGDAPYLSGLSVGRGVDFFNGGGGVGNNSIRPNAVLKETMSNGTMSLNPNSTVCARCDMLTYPIFFNSIELGIHTFTTREGQLCIGSAENPIAVEDGFIHALINGRRACIPFLFD